MTRVCIGALVSLLLVAGCTRRSPQGLVVTSRPAATSPTSAAAQPSASPAPSAASWTIEVAEGGSLAVKHAGARVASFQYVFWGKNWRWADPRVKNLRTVGEATTFELSVAPLGLSIAAEVKPTGPGELMVRYVLTASQNWEGINGGGLEFSFEPLGHPDPNGAPVASRSGFVWGAPGRALNVSFSPELAASYFEQNRSDTLRCMLVGDSIATGQRVVTMTVRLPSGGVVQPSLDQRYADGDTSAWPSSNFGWDSWPVDLSFLNERPAGGRGRVKADGDRLIFEDGTPIRFWGANVQAYALFHGKKDDVRAQAKRLAALGYNLVRLHHHDSAWVTPNVFDSESKTTQGLNEGALDSIDWWVSSLIEEGIYVWLDLHVGRRFKPGDGIDGFSELERNEGEGKGFCYVNPRIESLMNAFATQYLQRKNRYTGRRNADEPAVLGVLITNENDITHHFGNSMLPDKKNPVHQAMFEKLARERARRMDLPVSKSLRTWEAGPAKVVLADLERAFSVRAIKHLRELGFPGLVATTNFWGGESLFSLPPLLAGNVVDVHSYGAAEALSSNPRSQANWIATIGAAQVSGRPLTISEWNVEYPQRDRFTAPLYMAAVASLQGWDAPMIYGYVQSGIEQPERAEKWSTWTDPALVAVAPAAALLFRQNHVRQAEKTFRVDLTREALYYAETDASSSKALRTLVEQSRLTLGIPDLPELDWDNHLSTRGQADEPVTDLDRDFIPPGQNFVASDTGELMRDWIAGAQTIDTPRSQAAQGWVGRRRLALHDVAFEIETPKATVAVQSLDGKVIAESERLFVTTVSEVVPGPKGALPFRARPVTGFLDVRHAVPLRATPLQGDEYRSTGAARSDAEKPVRLEIRAGGWQRLTLRGERAIHWYLLTPDREPVSPSRTSTPAQSVH